MKIICLGLNYQLHIDDLGWEKPKMPVIFLKPESSILPSKEPFVIPSFTDRAEYELEVLVKISKQGKNIVAKNASDYYNEIGLGIDFCARDLQFKLKDAGHPWEIAKGFDGSAVISDEFVAKDKFTDLQNLNFKLEKNGTAVQVGNTSDMLVGIDGLIEHISKFYTLEKGDVIFTGTPAGIGRVDEGDVLKGFLEGVEMIDLKIK